MKITPNLAATYSKEQVMEALARGYTESKPINDALVDASLNIQVLTAEIYRRSIMKQLPGMKMVRRRTVMEVDTKIHPNNGLPLIAQRLVKLQEDGVPIVEVSYDENTGKFSFLTGPEFSLMPPITVNVPVTEEPKP